METRIEAIDDAARAEFVDRLDGAFSRDLVFYSETDRDERREFLAAAMRLAQAKGFASEQGMASYTLALWYLDLDFEEKSSELASLLASSLPELRKVHAMNHWVEAVLGEPDDIAAADEALKRSLKLTEAWGTLDQSLSLTSARPRQRPMDSLFLPRRSQSPQ